MQIHSVHCIEVDNAESFVLLQRRILDLSQIIHMFLDKLFKLATELPSPGLIDIIHACLDASGEHG